MKKNTLKMIFKKKIFVNFIFFFYIIFSSCSHAQVNDATLMLNTISSSQVQCSVQIEVSDTNLTAIEIGLGSEKNLTDLLLQEFEFDETNGLPSGMSYSRQGNIISIGVGSLDAQNYYFGKVRVKNSSLIWSDYYEFLQN